MVYQLYMIMENAKMYIYCTFTEDFIADVLIDFQNGVKHSSQYIAFPH